MTHSLFRVAVLLVLMSAGAGPSAASANWTPEPGHGYVKLWTKYLYGFGYVDGEGERTDYGRYHELFFSVYGQVGLADGLALTLHTDIARVFVLEDPRDGTSQTHVAPGDPQLGLRYRFFHTDRLVMSVSATGRAPIASDADQQEVRAREAPNEVLGQLRIGSGVFVFGFTYSVGYGFDRWYLAASIAYDVMTGGFDDRIGWSAEVGASFTPRFGGRLRLTGRHAIGNGDAVRGDSPSGLVSGASYTGFAVEVDYQLTQNESKGNWYLGFAFEGAFGFLKRQTGGPVLSLSIATQW